MGDLAVSLVTVVGVLVVVLAALGTLTLMPLVLTLQRAEQRGLAVGRWGGLALLGVVVGLGGAAVVVVAVGPVAALVPLLLTWTGPVLLRSSAAARLGGAVGAHR